MAAQRIHIDEFLLLAQQHPTIDVRSPGEYNHAHIPGAKSIPLFTDEERKVVGTAYKQQSRQAAIKLGLDFFGPKMSEVVKRVELLLSNKKNGDAETLTPIANCILVYCWRGGMRSGAISWLLDLYGFKVYTLIGGYKSFRNRVLQTFNQPFRFNVVGGYTGSGKTELLKALQIRGEKIIDLEGIACHKGSAFGSIGMPVQPSQEMFENILSGELSAWGMEHQQPHKPIWIEDESQRIGHINIPSVLWKKMRQSPIYFLDIPFEERLIHLTAEYGRLDTACMLNAIDRIKQKLGGLAAKQAYDYLASGNTVESFRILLKYYDKFYLKGLHNREALNSLLQSVVCKTTTVENANILLNVYSDKQKTV
ncbi:MAG: tRNA 2-selenouridine(34) synthase MnmH [Bacteroidota bacterium]|jgi:tRNA 2-selenouridine synthase